MELGAQIFLGSLMAIIAICGLCAYFRHDCRRHLGITQYGGLYEDFPGDGAYYHEVWWICPVCGEPIGKESRAARERALKRGTECRTR